MGEHVPTGTTRLKRGYYTMVITEGMTPAFRPDMFDSSYGGDTHPNKTSLFRVSTFAYNEAAGVESFVKAGFWYARAELQAFYINSPEVTLDKPGTNYPLSYHGENVGQFLGVVLENGDYGSGGDRFQCTLTGRVFAIRNDNGMMANLSLPTNPEGGGGLDVSNTTGGGLLNGVPTPTGFGGLLIPDAMNKSILWRFVGDI